LFAGKSTIVPGSGNIRPDLTRYVIRLKPSMTTMQHCNIEGCNNEAVEIVTFENGDGFFKVNMCTLHYHDYRSDTSIGKQFNLKDVAVNELYN
jgi:hypothetical protein